MDLVHTSISSNQVVKRYLTNDVGVDCKSGGEKLFVLIF